MTTKAAGRLDLFRAWPAGLRAMLALERTVSEAGLDPRLLELVRLRASQLNRCSYCLARHAHDALAGGDTPVRLIGLAGWRDSPDFNEAERAALALTDEITRCEHGVREDILSAARAHFSPAELTQLVYAITVINAWNRLAVADATPSPAHSTQRTG